MRFIDYIDKDIQTRTNSSSLTFPSSKRDIEKKQALPSTIGEKETIAFARVLSVAGDSGSKLLSMPTKTVNVHPIRRYFNSLRYS